MTVTQKLFSFQGRLRRRDYWLWSILLGLIFVVLYLVFAAAMGAGVFDDSGPDAIAQLLAALVIIWPSTAVGVKRLHDRDMSGWFYLITLVPFVGGIFALVVMGILDGTPGRNRFGPSPKYPETEADTFT